MSKPGRRAKSAGHEAPITKVFSRPFRCCTLALGLRCGRRSRAEIRRREDPDAVADGTAVGPGARAVRAAKCLLTIPKA
eukprot:1461677-Prymnesium_polylepis.1